MKKQGLMILALMGMTAGLSVHAQAGDEVASACSKKDSSCSASCSASTDEQAFAGKLTDVNRKVFFEKFSIEQRKSAMAMASDKSKKVASANEAVAKIMKDSHIAMEEVKNEASEAKTSVKVEVQTQTKAEPQLQAQAEVPASPVEAAAQPVAN